MTRTWKSCLVTPALMTAGIAAFTLTVDTREPAQSSPKRPPITGVATFAARVSSMEEARRFYSTVLGIPLVVVVLGAIRSRMRRGGVR